MRRFHGLEAPWPSAEDPRPDSFTRVWVKSKMIFIFPFLTLPVTILSYWASHSPHRPLSLSLMCALTFAVTIAAPSLPPQPLRRPTPLCRTGICGGGVGGQDSGGVHGGGRRSHLRRHPRNPCRWPKSLAPRLRP